MLSCFSGKFDDGRILSGCTCLKVDSSDSADSIHRSSTVETITLSFSYVLREARVTCYRAQRSVDGVHNVVDILNDFREVSDLHRIPWDTVQLHQNGFKF